MQQEWLQGWPESLLHRAQVHTRKLRLDADVDDEVLRQVARDLPGLSGEAQAMLPSVSMTLAAARAPPPCMPVTVLQALPRGAALTSCRAEAGSAWGPCCVHAFM